MKFICLTILLITGITDSGSEQYEVVGPADPVSAVAGEGVILPCFIKPRMSVVDMRVEWYRSDLRASLVHRYEDHEDRNSEQIQSYRGRTKLNNQDLQTGNASLKLSTVQVSDEGRYKCFIQSKSWFDDVTFDVKVEAVGTPPLITVDGFDRSGGLHLQCESEGWYPEPDLEWLDSEGIRLNPETTETNRNLYRFSVKHTITVHHRDSKIHCRVKLGHHMLETQMSPSSNMFNSWRTLIIMISVCVVLIVIAGILIVAFVYKSRELSSDYQFLQCQKSHIKDVITFSRKHKVNVTLDSESAHPCLIMSLNGKQVTDGSTALIVQQNDRFDKYLGVLGKEGFSSGCHYYEVKVKEKTEWDLGVARESINRKGEVDLNPENGYWLLGRRYDKYLSYDSPKAFFSLRVKPQRVGVFVDYDRGFVFFYEVKSMSHIYSYIDQSFNEKLYPFVCLGHLHSTNTYTQSTPLSICDDY